MRRNWRVTIGSHGGGRRMGHTYNAVVRVGQWKPFRSLLEYEYATETLLPLRVSVPLPLNIRKRRKFVALFEREQ